MRRFAWQAMIVLLAVVILGGAVGRCWAPQAEKCAKAHPCCPETQVSPCCAMQTGDPHGNQPGLAPAKVEYSGIAEVPAPAPELVFVSPAELTIAFGRTVDSAGLYLRHRVLLI